MRGRSGFWPALLGLLAAIALAVLVVIARRPADVLDRCVADELNRYVGARPGQLRFWTDVTTAGSPTVWRILTGGGAVALLAARRYAAAAYVVVAVVGAAILSTATKDLVDRSRPVVPHPVLSLGGQSFPSGHALTSFTAVGAALTVLLPLVSRGGRQPLVAGGAVAVGLVGFSRVILGVHFVTDVLGAWLIGVLWLLGLGVAFRAPLRPREQRPAR